MPVSIHATLAGGDINWTAYHKIHGSVSIHATLAGGDSDAGKASPYTSGFYPRHPRGWRLIEAHTDTVDGLFLSTPPSRVATHLSFRNLRTSL